MSERGRTVERRGWDAPVGDGAFEAFYRREYPGVLHLAWSLTGRRAVAEEVCQEAFLAAYRQWPRVAGYDAPGLWLRRVVTNRCVSVFRRRATEARHLRHHGRAGAEEYLDPEPPDEQLWAAVRALPRRQAQAVALVYVGDLSVLEAAEAMGCSVDTARTHLRRALATLEHRLSETADRERTGGDGGSPGLPRVDGRATGAEQVRGDGIGVAKSESDRAEGGVDDRQADAGAHDEP